MTDEEKRDPGLSGEWPAYPPREGPDVPEREYLEPPEWHRRVKEAGWTLLVALLLIAILWVIARRIGG